MRILLLGGTGAMGDSLTRILAEKGEKVTVTTRSPKKSSDNVNYVIGNAHDDIFLIPLLSRGWDVIVDFMAYHTVEFGIRVPRLLAATKQYIFISSARVYADSKMPITEDSPLLLDVTKNAKYLLTDEYALAKARQENILRKSESANWTIIRPYITYSESRLQLGVLEKEGWLYRAVQGRSIVFSNDIANHITTLTYGYDVASGIAATIGTEKALGEAFHIVTSENIYWNEVLNIYVDTIEQKTGRRPRVKMIDTSVYLWIKNAQYQVRYDRYFDRKFDNSKILSLVPDLQFCSPYEGLKHCLDTFLDKPIFRPLGFGTEALHDKAAGEHTPLSQIVPSMQKLKYLFCRYTPLFEIMNGTSK